MKRRVLNLMTALSLLLCVAASALCVLSFADPRVRVWSRGDWEGQAFHDRRVTIWYCRGDVVFIREHYWYRPTGGTPAEFEAAWRAMVPPFYAARDDRPKSDVLGWAPLNLVVARYAGSTHAGAGSRGHSRAVAVPLWMAAVLAAVLAALPAAWPRLARLVRRLRQLRLAKSGRCPTCGYDLRATPDRCPECGHTATTTT